MKKRKKKTNKILGILILIMLVLILIGTSFQAFLTPKTDTPITQEEITVYIGFNITGTEYP